MRSERKTRKPSQSFVNSTAVARKKISEHFWEYEFACRCKRPECDAAPMQKSFISKLEMLRVEWGRPLVPTSGRRCAYYNAEVNGAIRSQHLFGNAADFVFDSPSLRDQFVALAEKYSFLGIGVGRRLVHIDDRSEHARWMYSD